MIFPKALTFLSNYFTKSVTVTRTAYSRMSNSVVKIGVCQITATADKAANLSQCTQLIEQCAGHGAKMVFLPEAFDFIGTSKEDSRLAAEPDDGPMISAYKQLAKRHNIWLSLGGFKEKSDDPMMVYNTHILLSNSGDVCGKYRKIHLFHVDIPGKVKLTERDLALPGEGLSPLVATPVGNLALAICYDVRFPEMSLAYRQQGADVLTYPSVFTVPTGEAHWEVLLRARAIETQCYVIAAAQTGQHNEKRASYGHSMVVDPWGKVICEIKEGMGFAIAEIDISLIKKVRTELPVCEHRRHDIYGSIRLNNENLYDIDGILFYAFGHAHVPASCVFFKTQLSMAFVNRKPVVTGHILVSPLRVVRRFGELTSSELEDLFATTKRIASVLEQEYGCSSLTICVQDGPDAGQTVEHVHVHVLPRKPGDFSTNDDIYRQLEMHDKALTDTDQVPAWRSIENMSDEAGHLRKYFYGQKVDM